MGLVASQYIPGHGTGGVIIRPLKAIHDEPWAARARVPGWDGVNLTQSDVTAANCTVKRYDDGDNTETYNAAMTISSVISDTLATDNTWDEDGTGYNFSFTVPATAFPANDHYQVEFAFTTSGGTIRLIYRGTAVSSFG